MKNCEEKIGKGLYIVTIIEMDSLYKVHTYIKNNTSLLMFPLYLKKDLNWLPLVYNFFQQELKF